jgi:hypothetical protein
MDEAGGGSLVCGAGGGTGDAGGGGGGSAAFGAGGGGGAAFSYVRNCSVNETVVIRANAATTSRSRAVLGVMADRADRGIIPEFAQRAIIRPT